MNNYEKEKIEFESHFAEFKNKRIVLYGIGRFSATLIPLLKGWNIVGLMDRSSEKIGTYVYGLPIMELSEAESKADVIIINTSGTYWDLIYQRIKQSNIPIYFRNGKKAEELSSPEETEYWISSYEQLKTTINSYDIVSFDFFDTLFCRKTYMASDIWEYVGDSFNAEFLKKQYLKLRKSIYINISKEVPDIFDIYEQISFTTMELCVDAQKLLLKEIELENKFTEPRYVMLSLLKYAIAKNKEVYIISDMYLTVDFFVEKLKEYGVCLPREHIWISSDSGCTKKSGELWKKFKKEVIKERDALHIGDNIESDIEKCRQYAKSNAYYIMSKDEMVRNSSIRKCLDYADNNYHNMILGLCMSKLFNDPFALCDTKGMVKICNRKEFGYCVFGPVIFTFTYWLMRSLKADSVSQLYFLGRDGFFLKQDFEYLYKLVNETERVSSSYLETSRQILMTANIEKEEDFAEYIKMPYEGKLLEYFEDRLQIKMSDEDRQLYAGMEISLPQDYERIKEIIPRYQEKITEYIKITRGNYKKYLETFHFENQAAAVVDLGFYGTTQHYLSRLIDKEYIGYYIVANNSNSNVLSKKHILKSCTKVTIDESCKNAHIHCMGLAIESFLTSPKGMVRTVDRYGQLLYSTSTNNQVYFGDKSEINEGIQLFMKDMMEFHHGRLSGMNIYIDDFVDNWYGLCLKNIKLSEDVKRSFYNDNAFIHRRQERIFD